MASGNIWERPGASGLAASGIICMQPLWSFVRIWEYLAASGSHCKHLATFGIAASASIWDHPTTSVSITSGTILAPPQSHLTTRTHKQRKNIFLGNDGKICFLVHKDNIFQFVQQMTEQRSNSSLEVLAFAMSSVHSRNDLKVMFTKYCTCAPRTLIALPVFSRLGQLALPDWNSNPICERHIWGKRNLKFQTNPTETACAARDSAE